MMKFLEANRRSLSDLMGERTFMHQLTHLLAAGAIVVAGFVQQATHPEFTDPFWTRAFVVMMLLLTPIVVHLPGFRRYLEAWGFGVVELMCLWLIHLAYLNDFHPFLTFFIYFILVANGFFHVASYWRNLHFATVGTMMAFFLLISPAPIEVRLDAALTFGSVWITSFFIIIYLKRQETRLAQALAEASALNRELRDAHLMMEETQAVGQVGSWEINLSKPTLGITWSREIYRILEVPLDMAPTPELRRQFYSPQDFAALTTLLDRCAKEGFPFDVRWQVRTYRGQAKTVRIAGQRQVEAGKPRRLFGVFQDITQSYAAEEVLRRDKTRAESAAQAKSAFLSTMSHEIRTPLNAVIGLSHYLLESDPRPDQIETLHTLQTAGENLLSLINDILDFSKIEAGKLSIEPLPFALRPRLEAIRQTFDLMARQKRLTLRLDLDPALPPVIVADPNRLGQVLNNLLSNAIKFTSEGEVILAFRCGESLGEEVMLQVEVRDTGIGIPPEKLHNIFESFAQGRSGTSRQYGGTGLGLTITRQLLHLMGSEVRVESTEGVGSCFRFDLLVPRGSMTSLKGEERRDTKVQGLVCHILLAEDNEVNIRVMQRFLEKWGHQVTIAENGLEAVAKARTLPIDLILMDLQMPKMDGIEATRHIRAFAPTLPIIALTADATAEVRSAVIAAGMNDYSPKPFVPAVLRGRIEAALIQAQASSQQA